MVLQSQIDSLSEWVSEKRLGIRDELYDSRLEHIEQTLQGFRAQTDATLRGVAGVMGDALKQYQDTLNEINKTRDEASRAAATVKRELMQSNQSSELNEKLMEIEQKATKKIDELMQKSAFPIPAPVTLNSIEIECPNCGSENSLAITSGTGQTKSTSCAHCAALFNVHSSGSGTYFTRLIRLSQSSQTIQNYSSHHIPNVSIPPSTQEVMIAIGHPYTIEQFKLFSLILVSALNSALASENVTINSLKQKMKEILPDQSSTIISGFIKMQFWGRSFKFEGAPSYNSIIKNSLSLDDVIVAFCRSAGRTLKLSKSNLDLTNATNQIDKFFHPLHGGRLSSQLMQEFSVSYNATNESDQSNPLEQEGAVADAKGDGVVVS